MGFIESWVCLKTAGLGDVNAVLPRVPRVMAIVDEMKDAKAQLLDRVEFGQGDKEGT